MHEELTSFHAKIDCMFWNRILFLRCFQRLKSKYRTYEYNKNNGNSGKKSYPEHNLIRQSRGKMYVVLSGYVYILKAHALNSVNEEKQVPINKIC